MRGIVLAGGRSRRMGQDKALVELRGLSLLARTIGRLAPQCEALAISRHEGTCEGADPRLPILADGAVGRAGPLAGLLAGLDWVAEVAPDATHAVTVAVDMPFLPPDVVDRLQAARRAMGAEAAVAWSGERRHPVAALWPVAARLALREALYGDGLCRVGQFLDRFDPAAARWPAEPYDPFFNINTPEDLAVAETIDRGVDHSGPPRAAAP